jgi:ribonuclease HI
MVEIYADGACRGNGKKQNKGGWAALICFNGTCQEYCGAERNTTNQRMELQAVIQGIRRAHEHFPAETLITVLTDSMYVVKCIQDHWWLNWVNNGWKNAKGQPVANRDLWESLLAATEAFTLVRWQYVKGHAGHPMNERADALATRAIDRLTP